MSWTQDELREIEVGRTQPHRKKGKNPAEPVYTTQMIPAPYDRIISQLLIEEAHGALHSGHEAVRRQTYAQRVLDAFWIEIKEYKGEPTAFRSKVLTPILQRQLAAIQENYGPAVRAAVRNGNGNPTITDATRLYLGVDPTDPGWIPNYRRNLLHIPEARWHLGVIIGSHKVGQAGPYNAVHNNQDLVDKRAKSQLQEKEKKKKTEDDGNDGTDSETQGDSEDDGDSETEDGGKIPPLDALDIQVILYEKLQDFFKPELDQVVRALSWSSSIPMGSDHHHIAVDRGPSQKGA